MKDCPYTCKTRATMKDCPYTSRIGRIKKIPGK
jgi:hypothetical protein